MELAVTELTQAGGAAAAQPPALSMVASLWAQVSLDTAAQGCRPRHAGGGTSSTRSSGDGTLLLIPNCCWHHSWQPWGQSGHGESSVSGVGPWAGWSAPQGPPCSATLSGDTGRAAWGWDREPGHSHLCPCHPHLAGCRGPAFLCRSPFVLARAVSPWQDGGSECLQRNNTQSRPVSSDCAPAAAPAPPGIHSRLFLNPRLGPQCSARPVTPGQRPLCWSLQLTALLGTVVPPATASKPRCTAGTSSSLAGPHHRAACGAG